MAEQQIVLKVVASGTEQAAAALKSLGQSGAQLGSVVASGANEARGAYNALAATAEQAAARMAAGMKASDLKAWAAAHTVDLNQVANAYKTLSVRSSADIAEARNRILDAYNTIKNSSSATTADVARAHTAMTAQMKALDKEARGAGSGFTSSLIPSLTSANAALNGAGVQTGMLGQVLGALTSPLGLAAIGVGVLTAGVLKATSVIRDNMMQVRELMAVSGLSADAADNLADTFQILGRDTGALATGLFRMSGELDQGGEAFRNLGIDVRDSAGALKAEGDLFLEVRDRLSDFTSGAVRSSIAIDIFGRGARQLADIFAMSREEFRKWQDEGGKLSGWTAEQQRAAEQYARQMNQLSMQFDAFWIAVGTPIVTHGEAFLRWINNGIRAAREFGDVVENFWRKFSTDAQIARVEALMAAEAAAKVFAKAGSTLPEEGVRLAGPRVADEAVLTKPARDEIKRLQDQLEQIRATDAQRPIVALNQAMDEFMKKARVWGPEAERIGKQLFEGLIDEAKFKQALAIREAQIDQLFQRTIAAADRAQGEVDLLRAQGLIDERAAIEESIRGIKQKEDAELAANARRMGMLREQAARGGGTVDVAAMTALETAREGIVIKAEAAIQAAKTKTAALDFAYLTEAATRYQAMADREIELADAVLSARESAALQIIELTGSEEEAFRARAEAEARAAMIAATRTMNETNAADAIATIYQVLGAKLAKFEADRTRVALDKMHEWLAGIEDLADDGAASMARSYQKQQQDIDIALKLGLISAETAEKAKLALTENRLLQESRRVESQISRNAELYALDVTNYDSAENKRLRQAAANIAKERSLREQLINDEIALRVKAGAGIDEAAARRLAVEAGTVRGILAERQKIIDNLDTMGDKERLFWEQGIAHAAAYAKSIGDTAGFFDATFTAALTKGTDTFSSLKTLAEGLAADLKSSLGSFFTDFKANLDQGLGFWQSFTSALSSLWNSLMNSLINRFANLLVDMALQAAASQSGGGFLAALFGAGAAAASAGSAGPTFNNSDPNATFGTGTGVSGVYGGIGASITSGIGAAGGLSFLTTAFNSIRIGVDTFRLSLNLGSTALQSLGDGLQAFGGALVAARTPVFQALGIAAAAVTVAITAMRTDINDATKAWLTSMYAVSAGLIAFGGPIGVVVGLVLAAVTAIVDFSGILVSHSKAWLTFGTRLSETLGQVQGAVIGFGDELSKASDLTGIATSIENLRHGMDAFLPGFFDRTKGLGLFTIPGIPGATGTEHEGKISVSFNSLVADMQAAINEVLDAVRDSISVKLADVAKRILPDDVAAAFVKGTIGALRQGFEDLVASTTATIDDIKAFEERMKAVGELMAGFAQAALTIRETRFNAAALLPSDIAAGVSAWADVLQRRLVDLAASGTATAEALKAAQADINALATGVALLHGVRQMIASLSGDVDTMTAAAVASIAAMRGAAGRAVEDAQRAAAGATTGPEAAAAYTALIKAIQDKYALEMKLVQDVEAAISSTLQTVGALYLQSTGIGIGAALAKGDTGPLLKFIATMDDVAASSNSTVLTLWAVVQAFAAVNAAIQPLLLSGNNMADVVQGAIDAIAPSVSRLKELYDQALAAGDIQGAMAILQQGADLITSTHQALVAGIEAMAQAEIARYQRALQVIQTYGGQLANAATVYATTLAELGDLSGMRNVLTALQEIGDTASSVALKMWAAASAINAINAINAAIPAVVGGGLVPENAQGLGMLVEGVYGALRGPLSTIDAAFKQALGSGDFQGALDILGQAATLVQQTAAALIQGIRSWEQAAVEAAQAAGQEQIAALQQAADLETEKNSKAIEALQLQKDTAQKALEVSRAWARVVDSVSKLIVDLKLGTSSPLNPRAALAFAQSNLSIAEAAFAASGTPENAAAVQTAIQNVLSAGQNVWTRPSPEWNTLFTSMIGKLEGLKATAAARVTPEEAAAASLASIDDQIKALQDKNKLIADTLKLNVDAVNKATAAQVAAIHQAADAQVAVVKGDLANLMRDIALQQYTILSQFGPELDAAAAKTERAIREAAAAQLVIISGLYAGVMEWVAGQSEEQLRATLAQQVALLNTITGGQSVQAFMAQKAKDTVDQLVLIKDILGQILAGIPLPAGIPQGASGIERTREGLYYLHNDERVQTKEEADWTRSGRYAAPAPTYRPVATRERESGGGTMTVVFEAGSVVIQGVSDPERASDLAVKKVERMLENKWRYKFGLDRVKH